MTRCRRLPSRRPHKSRLRGCHVPFPARGPSTTNGRRVNDESTRSAPPPEPLRLSDDFTFVVGCPRSGTTLLRAMLDSHSELAIPGESYFVVQLEPKFGPRWWRPHPCATSATNSSLRIR